MNPSRFRYAELDADRLGKVRKLEKEMGVLLVALEQEFKLADLSDEKMKALKKAEEELGIVLLAYNSDK